MSDKKYLYRHHTNGHLASLKITRKRMNLYQTSMKMHLCTTTERTKASADERLDGEFPSLHKRGITADGRNGGREEFSDY